MLALRLPWRCYRDVRPSSHYVPHRGLAVAQRALALAAAVALRGGITALL